MIISYDYREIIKELKEELRDGILSLTDTIQVLRSDSDVCNGYRPIIDWYYDNDKMMKLLKGNFFDDEEDFKELHLIKEPFEKDVPLLENIFVGVCLMELKERSKIV